MRSVGFCIVAILPFEDELSATPQGPMGKGKSLASCGLPTHGFCHGAASFPDVASSAMIHQMKGMSLWVTLAQ